MSSESNGRKPDSPDGAPPSAGRRPNASVASAWGPSRGALAAVHNLEALLRSPSVPRKTLLDLIPELRSSAATLQTAAQVAIGGESAKHETGTYGSERVRELDALLDAVETQADHRPDLASRAGTLADELEACVDLLALLDLASAPVSTEVTLNLVAREVGRMSGTARGREVLVRFDETTPDCAVITDPYVLGPLMSLLVGCVHASRAESFVLRVRCHPRARFIVEATAPADANLPILPIRVMPWIAPSDHAARRVAERLGAALDLGPGRGSITLASVAGD
ncbi:MAG: hypothetical protein ABSF69_14710 [Polyangiaceae bacterium]|jgi:hypothetical protein